MTLLSINEAPMQSHSLGRTGPSVTQFALDTLTFEVETEEAEAFRQLDRYVDQGGNFIDTADVHGAGKSEEIIGKWGRRRGGIDQLIIATKGRFGPPAGSHGASRRSLVRSVDASLKRLQLDAIDLCFIHGWDRHIPIVETLATLDDLVRAGKIHNVAWSKVSGWQLQSILSTAAAHALPSPVAVQPQYNLLDRGIEIEVLPCCLEQGIALTPWSPLGGGRLTGKYAATSGLILARLATRCRIDPVRRAHVRSTHRQSCGGRPGLAAGGVDRSDEGLGRHPARLSLPVSRIMIRYGCVEASGYIGTSE